MGPSQEAELGGGAWIAAGGGEKGGTKGRTVGGANVGKLGVEGGGEVGGEMGGGTGWVDAWVEQKEGWEPRGGAMEGAGYWEWPGGRKGLVLWGKGLWERNGDFPATSAMRSPPFWAPQEPFCRTGDDRGGMGDLTTGVLQTGDFSAGDSGMGAGEAGKVTEPLGVWPGLLGRGDREF